MSEKNEVIKDRIKMFKESYALPLVTGITIGAAIFVTTYSGARIGAESAVKNIKINLQMKDSEGNTLNLPAEM